MNIEQLLEHYFEGYTSAEEEAMLRRFFTTDDVPEHLNVYIPLFTYYENQINLSKTSIEGIAPFAGRGEAALANTTPAKEKANSTIYNGRRVALWLSGVAASAAIIVGIFFYAFSPKKCDLSGNYVIIDGRCFTDAATIRSTTLKTLHEFAEEDELSSDDKPSTITNMVENQLKEFDFLLDE